MYKARSPINAIDRITAPLLLLQGADDRVVPPNQAQLMYDKLKAAGTATALVMFEGEGHGFRKAANIRAALDGELFFYSRVWGFAADVPDDVALPTIVNR